MDMAADRGAALGYEQMGKKVPLKSKVTGVLIGPQ